MQCDAVRGTARAVTEQAVPGVAASSHQGKQRQREKRWRRLTEAPGDQPWRSSALKLGLSRNPAYTFCLRRMEERLNSQLGPPRPRMHAQRCDAWHPPQPSAWWHSDGQPDPAAAGTTTGVAAAAAAGSAWEVKAAAVGVATVAARPAAGSLAWSARMPWVLPRTGPPNSRAPRAPIQSSRLGFQSRRSCNVEVPAA